MQSVRGGSPVVARGPNRANCEPISSNTLQVLEEEARVANEHLRITHNEHLQGNSNSLNKSDTRSTSSYDKIKINPSHNENESTWENSDENINKAMRNLHTHIRWLSETREDYKAWQAASACLRKKHAAEILEWRILRAHVTIVDELNQLLDEQEEYDATRHNPIEMDRRNRHNLMETSLMTSKEIRRCDVENTTSNGYPHRMYWIIWDTTTSRIPASWTYPTAIRGLLMVGTHARIP